jgi:ribonuclease-3
MLPLPPDALQKVIRIKFKSVTLLEEALTHKSHAIENGAKIFNERLEFLGDSILSAATSHWLFKRYPSDDEGKLSKLKSQLVSRASLVVWARSIDLGQYLLMSPGEESTGGRDRESLLANAFEALIGAIFLDQGFQKAQLFIIRFLSKKKRIVETDYKSKLQELIQKRFKVPPTYLVISETGPDHAKTFLMEVRIRRRLLGKGEGRSKKEAEQSAAFQALKSIRARRSSDEAAEDVPSD